jgi:hypothetical protein
VTECYPDTSGSALYGDRSGDGLKTAS